jgi:murein DD-endopeptidase MepM/ murein hydrolase activator NlpD
VIEWIALATGGTMIVDALLRGRVPLPLAVPTFPGVVAQGKLTSGYLVRRSDTHLHRGVDIWAAEGTPLRSVNEGTVYGIYPDGVRSGYGNSILIAHPDGMYSFYAHLQGFAVREGQSVRRGQVIGTVGRTQARKGGVTSRPTMAPHVHMEVHTEIRDWEGRRGYPQISENTPDRIDPVEYMARVGTQVADVNARPEPGQWVA